MKNRYPVMEEEKGGTGSAGAGTGALTTPSPAAGTGENPPPAAWYDSFKDQGVKDWLKSYNDAYPNPEAVALKAWNLEKFVGADKAGRGVIAPKPDDKPEVWAEFFKKVAGVPDSPDKYVLPKDLAPEALSVLNADPMVNKFREHAHKAGMPPMFFESVLNWYASEVGGMEKASLAEFEKRTETEMREIEQEWGKDRDKNIEMGRRAAKMFIPHNTPAELQEVMHKMEGALGTKMLMKIWAAIGNGIAEHDTQRGDGSSGFTMTKEAAKMRIEALKADRAWGAKYASGDAEAMAEMTRLMKIAYPQ